MCDKKNSVLFIDTECIVLYFDFKLLDESHVLLRVHRENNMYNVDLKNIVPSGDLTCIFAKATLDESNLWHRRLGHINFKKMNKLVKGNLVRGLPSNVFKNNHTCVACKKGKQHRAFCESKPVSSVSQPLQRVLVTKPQNKTPYELLLGRTHSIGFMKPFGCRVTILNTLDPLGKFNGKVDEGFLVGYSVSSNQPNFSVGIQENFDADKAGEGNVQQYVLFPLWSYGSKDPQNTDVDTTFEVKQPEFEVYVSPSSSAQTKKHNDKTKREAKGKSHEEGIDYEEVFTQVARIEAIRLFLAYASFMGFMDLKILIILIRFTKWSRHSMDCIKLLELGLQVKQKQDGIFISQDKYVAEILRKFGLTDRKSASTPIDTEKPLLKDPDGEDVDVHTY
nr:putative ribonuclease H-like domain-containing protein [Tanacetum cinerariifolium]